MQGDRREYTLRLLSRVTLPMDEDGCWIWTGSLSHGYGFLTLGGEHGAKRVSAHVAVYKLFKGNVPRGMELHHKCHVKGVCLETEDSCPHRRCVNPEHLGPVTHEVNVREGNAGHGQKRPTHCSQGHAYIEGSFTVDGRGKRRCRECIRRKNAAYYLRHKIRVS